MGLKEARKGVRERESECVCVVSQQKPEALQKKLQTTSWRGGQ